MSQELSLITKEIKALESRMISLLPKDVAQREISFALQHIANSPQLQKCSIQSLQSAVFNIANIGLSLNPVSKQAYLVPKWDKAAQSYVAKLEPSYVGLAKTLTDCGAVKSINTQLVYRNDFFESDLAAGWIKHTPPGFDNRGDLIGCYSLAVLPDGKTFPEMMSLKEAHEIRERSDSYASEKTRQYSPWETSFGEMFRKSVIRRLYKYLPRTGVDPVKLEKLEQAINLDDSQYNASFNQLGYIENLLRTANISPEVEQRISSECQNYSNAEAETCINFLQANQLESDNPAKQFAARLKN